LIVRHARVHLKGRTDGLDDTDARVLAADAQQLEVLTGVLRPPGSGDGGEAVVAVGVVFRGSRGSLLR